MSMCDRCYQPGACCRLFTLNIGTAHVDEGNAGAQARLDGRSDSQGRPYPFVAVGPANERWGQGEREYAYWLFSCPKVTAEGLCSIYEDRPDTCRMFEAGSNRLCVHHQGAEMANEIAMDNGGVVTACTEEDGPGREVDEVELWT